MVQTLTLRLTLIRTQTLLPLKTVLSAEELKNGLKRHCISETEWSIIYKHQRQKW